MKVGIISKPDHAKSHAAALEAAGFTPVMLGGNPSEVPPTVPLLVCRTMSCSHAGTNLALAWSRAGKGTLIVENGVKAILDKAIRARKTSGLEEGPKTSTPKPVQVPYADLCKAAEDLVRAQPHKSLDSLTGTLSHMFPHEDTGLLRAAVATVSTPAPVEPEVPMPFVEFEVPMPTPVKRPYPDRFAAKFTEEAVDHRMEAAWQVRERMSPVEVDSFNAWVQGGCRGEVPTPVLSLRSNPIGVAGLVLLCAGDTPVTRGMVAQVYGAAFNKSFHILMAEIAAWWLNVTLASAADVPTPARAPKPSVTPMPEQTPAPNRNNADNAELLAAIQALSKSLDALTAKVDSLGSDVDRLKVRADAVVAPGTPGGDTLAALAALGLEVVVRSPSR